MKINEGNYQDPTELDIKYRLTYSPVALKNISCSPHLGLKLALGEGKGLISLKDRIPFFQMNTHAHLEGRNPLKPLNFV